MYILNVYIYILFIHKLSIQNTRYRFIDAHAYRTLRPNAVVGDKAAI